MALIIAVCDDEKIFRDEITDRLYDFFGRLELDCESYENGEEVVTAYIGGKKYDAVFLDIEMPVMDGMTAAARLRKNGFEGPVIFLTSHTEMAMDGYEVGAFRFLPKPIDDDKMNKTLNSLRGELREKKRIIIRYEGEDIVLRLNDIRYIEAMNDMISVVTLDTEYLVRKRLSDMEEELNGISDSFVRIHRGYIVNMAHIKKHHGNDIVVTGGVTLPISRRMADNFKKQLFRYVRNSAG